MAGATPFQSEVLTALNIFYSSKHLPGEDYEHIFGPSNELNRLLGVTEIALAPQNIKVIIPKDLSNIY